MARPHFVIDGSNLATEGRQILTEDRACLTKAHDGDATQRKLASLVLTGQRVTHSAGPSP